MPLPPLRRAWAAVPLRSRITGVDAETVRRWLADLPPPPGYAVSARPLRYRQAPHLAAFCWYEDRLIELQVPEPFRAWDEKVYYRARRQPAPRFASAGSCPVTPSPTARPICWSWSASSAVARTS